jgi:dTDP-4-dehydrorhamnose 3,5-epimerase-like enzyme
MKYINDCFILEFPKIEDPRGALTYIQNSLSVPFDIKRVYFLYDISAGAKRAGHSHKLLHQVLIAVSGSFDVELDDGLQKSKITLNLPYQGLFIPEGIWRSIDNFSAGAVCLSLASELYDEADYYREYKDFLASRQVK